MTDTIRERIIQAFQARAAPLSNLPIERVLRSINETNERFITLWDGEDQALESGYSIQKMQFPIILECVFRTGIENPSITANTVMGEIIKTLFTGSQTFSNLATNMTLQSIAPNYPADGSEYTAILATFNITYMTVKGDPFTAAP
jgi:hypothetical protein